MIYISTRDHPGWCSRLAIRGSRLVLSEERLGSGLILEEAIDPSVALAFAARWIALNEPTVVLA